MTADQLKGGQLYSLTVTLLDHWTRGGSTFRPTVCQMYSFTISISRLLDSRTAGQFHRWTVLLVDRLND